MMGLLIAGMIHHMEYDDKTKEPSPCLSEQQKIKYHNTLRHSASDCEYMVGNGKKVTRLEDRDIIALFDARSEQAIDELGKKHGGYAKKVAFNILHDAQDAEETVNDTYLAVWNTIPPQNPDPLRTYVCRIARNLAVTRLREKTAEKRNGSYDAALDELAEVLSAQETVESACAAAELTAAIDAFLDAVSYDDRYMFMRRFWYGDSVSDIAAAMRMGPHRVTVRLSRIRKRLSDYLKKEGLLQ